jgi:hypothetical protein
MYSGNTYTFLLVLYETLTGFMAYFEVLDSMENDPMVKKLRHLYQQQP